MFVSLIVYIELKRELFGSPIEPKWKQKHSQYGKNIHSRLTNYVRFICIYSRMCTPQFRKEILEKQKERARERKREEWEKRLKAKRKNFCQHFERTKYVLLDWFKYAQSPFRLRNNKIASEKIKLSRKKSVQLQMFDWNCAKLIVPPGIWNDKTKTKS